MKQRYFFVSYICTGKGKIMVGDLDVTTDGRYIADKSLKRKIAEDNSLDVNNISFLNIIELSKKDYEDFEAEEDVLVQSCL